MIRIEGQYNEAICYTTEAEQTAENQIGTVCDQELFAGCKIRIMPDMHAGMGCTIGATMTITDKVVPGVDIGCGMETVKLADGESCVYSKPGDVHPGGDYINDRYLIHLNSSPVQAVNWSREPGSVGLVISRTFQFVHLSRHRKRPPAPYKASGRSFSSYPEKVI